jgi:hypothetical protein
MEAVAASLATSGGTAAVAGTYGAAGGASLGAGFTGVGAGSAAASAGAAAAGGGFFSGLGTFLSSVSLLDTITTVGAFDSVISPIITGNRNADIANINAQQQEFDASQKLLQGREASVRALETLNSQQAFNVVQGFASGTGLSQSTAAANDELSRKQRFDDDLRRTTNLLQAGSINRAADLQRRTGQVGKRKAAFDSFNGTQRVATLFDEAFS